MARTRVDDLHRKWTKNPRYRREYKALEEEFSLVGALIEARTRAGLTQEQVARRMNDAGGRRTAGKRRCEAFLANSGAIRRSHWLAPEDHFRAGAESTSQLEVSSSA